MNFESILNFGSSESSYNNKFDAIRCGIRRTIRCTSGVSMAQRNERNILTQDSNLVEGVEGGMNKGMIMNSTKPTTVKKMTPPLTRLICRFPLISKS